MDDELPECQLFPLLGSGRASIWCLSVINCEYKSKSSLEGPNYFTYYYLGNPEKKTKVSVGIPVLYMWVGD